MQRLMMQKMLTRIKESPLFAWIKHSLTGGGIGFFCGMLFSQAIQIALIPLEFSSRSDFVYDYHVVTIVSAIMFWLPVGLGIGIAQWLKLRDWDIQANGWIFGTVLGWGSLGIALALANDYFTRQGSLQRWQMFTTYALLVMIGGMCIGVFQSVTVRNVLPKSGLWILTNMLGVFGLIGLSIAVVAVPFALKSYILKFFYAHDLYGLVAARDLLLLGFLTIALPVIGTFTLFMPTGKVLLKYIKTG